MVAVRVDIAELLGRDRRAAVAELNCRQSQISVLDRNSCVVAQAPNDLRL